ncbi:MAG: hypothetical protein ACJA0Q_002142, partial [Saprospiraceae bacterium]
MKKQLYIFSLLILTSAVSSAQLLNQRNDQSNNQNTGLNLKWGTYEKIGKKLYGKEIVHENESHVYVFEREKKSLNFLFFQITKPPGLILSVYSCHDLSLVKLNHIHFPSQGKVKYEYSFLKLIEIKNKLFLFVKAVDTKTDAVKLLAQEISVNGSQQGVIFEIDQGVAIKSSGLFKRT